MVSKSVESVPKRKPNWLLRGLVIISLAIHLVIFVHVAGIYRSSALTYIELSLKDVSKPPDRNIPRPRVRPKPLKQPGDVKKLSVRTRAVSNVKPMRADPVDTVLPDSLVEQVSMPDIPDHRGPSIAKWDPGQSITEQEPGPRIATGDYLNSNDYLQMVRLRIEGHKRYPKLARRKHIEGQTTVRFVIQPDGKVTDLEIIKKAPNSALKRAAINAIKDASPFPVPPKRLFNGPIPVEITIVFELT